MSEYQIDISVNTAYMEGESAPEQMRFVFAYTINIHNTGSIAARLLSRHWIITDADGKVQEVRGKGVIGKQPYLEPDEIFTYTSGTMIETPVGFMQGSYQMEADDGTKFDAPISAFRLAVPNTLN